MFLKKALYFIFAHILLLGSSNTQVYVTPTTTPVTKKDVAKTIIATSTNPISTTTIVKKENKSTTTKKPAKSLVNTKSATSTVPKPAETLNLPTPSFTDINTFARQAVVNILCTTKGGSLSPISGTGIVVTPNGLILTNAHIAEYFLLRDFRGANNIECNIRTGSPAYPTYHAELVYISPNWVANNKALLKEAVAKGTGENDFAFIRITDKIDGTKLPETFWYIPMDVREIINKDESVLLASYPAGFLGGVSILQDLNVTTAITTVQEIYTYKEKTADLISVPGTVVSQRGSSGGGVVDKYATLIGIISTSSDGDTTSQRDLRAITLAYINRDLQSELGIDLKQFITQDLTDFAKKFQETNVPNLTKLITDELNKQ